MASSMLKRAREQRTFRLLPDSVVLTILRMLDPLTKLRAIEALRLPPPLREELDLWPVEPWSLGFQSRPELVVLPTNKHATQNWGDAGKRLYDIESLLCDIETPSPTQLATCPLRTGDQCVSMMVRRAKFGRSINHEVVYISDLLDGPVQELGRLRLCAFAPFCVSVRLLPRTKAFEKAVEADIKQFNQLANERLRDRVSSDAQVVRLRNFALQ
jgi:hypothetical protein